MCNFHTYASMLMIIVNSFSQPITSRITLYQITWVFPKLTFTMLLNNHHKPAGENNGEFIQIR